MIWYEDRSEPRPILNMGGQTLTPQAICLAAGMGVQAQKKPLMRNIGTAPYTAQYLKYREQLEDWYGI